MIKTLKKKSGFQKGNQFGKMNKGKKHNYPPWNKGKKTGLIPKTAFKRGYKHTEEWKEMMSKKMKGKNCYNWKGGISSENKKFNRI